MEWAKSALLISVFAIGAYASLEDDPNSPETEKDTEVRQNREALLSQMASNAEYIENNMSLESLETTSQLYDRLYSLMAEHPEFVVNMKSAITVTTIRDALKTISPVTADSELAKMGFLAYIPVNMSGFGARFIFDGRGHCLPMAADNLEFVFPANVSGVGATLCKMTLAASDECYESVLSAKLKNLQHIAYVIRLPKSFKVTLSAVIDDEEVALSNGTLSFSFPQDPQTGYVASFFRPDAVSGQLDTYLPTAGNGMTINSNSLSFSLAADEEGLSDVSIALVSDGVSIVELKEKTTQPKEDVSLGHLPDGEAKATMLNNLEATCTIADGHLSIQQLWCPKMTKPMDVKLLTGEDAVAQLENTLNVIANPTGVTDNMLQFSSTILQMMFLSAENLDSFFE